MVQNGRTIIIWEILGITDHDIEADSFKYLGTKSNNTNDEKSGFSGLEVACWPLVPKFAGLNPAEAVGFFRATESSARLPSERK